MREALLWRPRSQNRVQCELCSQYCLIKDGERGKCGVRLNQGGTLFTLVFDKVAAANLDPIEKKPLYHFLPGTTSFSIGTQGCNIACGFCQNYSLSQSPKEGRDPTGEAITPERIVATAKDLGAASISYTYSEPTIFFELVMETARLAVEEGLKNILVSNGFMTDKMLDSCKDVIHAANVDLKAFTDRFYKELCDARLNPVLDNLRHIRRLGWHLEVTSLIIPNWNDSEDELRQMAGFIANDLGKSTPWHLSRYHPTYKMTEPSTPVETLERAFAIGKEAGLEYVYLGNVPGHDSNSTKCPECGCVCIKRSGYQVAGPVREDGSCPECGHKTEGVFA
ncbi:AmmeMemoRadiSam system radical SAM enzyme [Desulfohalovibrio reitneri]|uniref:AmmeMemoRadiSam system radical SAM enzyme n=1 Tax=Desulfohalovibrio reitneri TaxID=1307759 RepID=UPI0004A729A5|nr:AmmeMemoRadiSam system radical SAM enzyme [Desulfohalovibrio reitneri]